MERSTELCCTQRTKRRKQLIKPQQRRKKGTAMLIKLNRILRYIVLILGGLCVIFKLKEKKTTEKELFGEGFQREEFDDIW